MKAITIPMFQNRIISMKSKEIRGGRKMRYFV